MLISKISISAIRLPLHDPFVVSYAMWDAMPAVIVRLETDEGLVGWGEAVPDENVTGEHYRATAAILEHLLAPIVLGSSPFDLEELHRRMDAVIHDNPAAKAALDIACHDVVGQATGRPLWQLLGGRAHDDLTYPRVLSIGEPDEMAAKADDAVAAGFAHIKVKAGAGDPRDDVARVRAVCEAVDGRVPVRVDVNQGWRTPSAAIAAARQLEGLGLAWLEQPIRMGDVAGLAEVRRATSVPIMADETCHGLESLLEIIRHRAADLINIKLMKTAGIYWALQLASVAEAAGIAAQVGSMVESSIGSAAGYHVATARTNIVSTELTGPLLFSADVADLRYDPPRVLLSDRPGLGLTVDTDAVADLTEHQVCLSV